MMNPFRWVQQTGEIEKATGYKINWRQFGGGGDVIRAMASGDVAIGEVGSAGVATAIQPGHGRRPFLDSRGHRGGRSARRAQRQRASTASPTCKGKKVGVPFVSTTHFHLLYAMELAGLKRGDVQILNMRPPEIAAAWGRGDHRRDVHLGPGAVERQEERQGASSRRANCARRANARSTA